jgi:hypothetical protein
MDFGQGAAQIIAKIGKLARNCRLWASDKHVVPSRLCELWQDGAGNLAQASFGAIARHGIADFLGASIADADGSAVIFAVAGLKQKAGLACALGAGSFEKISALSQNL